MKLECEHPSDSPATTRREEAKANPDSAFPSFSNCLSTFAMRGRSERVLVLEISASYSRNASFPLWLSLVSHCAEAFVRVLLVSPYSCNYILSLLSLRVYLSPSLPILAHTYTYLFLFLVSRPFATAS